MFTKDEWYMILITVGIVYMVLLWGYCMCNLKRWNDDINNKE